MLTYEVTLENAVITHESKVNAAGDEITVKATGDWGTNEYVIKRVAAAK